MTFSDFKVLPIHLERLNKAGDKHKYDHGHAVFVSGAYGQGGAIRLAARAGLRVGAGLVTVLSDTKSQSQHVARLDAVMVKTFQDAKDFGQRLSDLKPDAVGIGPNLGLERAHQEQIRQVLSLECPVCLDADALTVLSQAVDMKVHADAVLTPHEGELRRLVPEDYAQTRDRARLAQAVARKYGCTVLFKGAETIVMRPDGTGTCVRPSGPWSAWLATAGSGDVLTGLITGLMARGFVPFDAAALGAALHLRCAELIGPGLIAEDLPDAVPAVLRAMLAKAP